MTRRRLSAEQLEARDVPATAFALGTAGFANTLYRFDTATPGTVSTGIAVTGLTTFVLGGIDFRPATGQLYGVGVDGDTAQVFTIDPNTGAATAVGGPAAVTGLTGATSFGVDFNPVPDRIRVVTNLASDGAGGNTNNFRLHPDTGALVAIDADLDFTAVPGGAPEVAVAYLNPDTDTATGTTLFGIVSGSDQLVTNGGAAPGFNVLTAVGALGVDTGVNAGLDIFGPGNQAVSLLEIGGLNGLYTVNLATGANTFVGNVGDGTLDLSDVAVAPPATPVLVGGSLDGGLVPLAPTLFGANLGQVTAGTAVTAFANSTVNVRTASGDVNGDGFADVIAVTGPGTPIRVTVISGADNKTVLVAPFDPFPGSDFTGGGFVAAGDFDAGSATPDGRAEFVVTPDQGGGPRVSVFRLASGATAAELRANFFGIDDPAFRGGARAAAGDINNDGRLDLVAAAGFLGGPRVAIFTGTTLLSGTPTKLVGDFFAFPGTDAQTLRNGAFVAAGDVNGDGSDDLVFGGGPGGAPRVFILSGALVSAGTIQAAYDAPVANFFVANNSTSRAGIRVGTADLDGDARADVVVGSGEGVDGQVRLYRGANFTASTEPAIFQDVDVFGTAALANGVFVG